MEIEEGEIDQDGMNAESGQTEMNVERDNTMNRNEDSRGHKEEHKEEELT